MFASLCSQLRNDFSSVCGLVQEELALFGEGQHGVLTGNSKWLAEDLESDISFDVNQASVSQRTVTYEGVPLAAYITNLTLVLLIEEMRSIKKKRRRTWTHTLKHTHTQTPTCSSVRRSVLALHCSSWWNVAHWCLLQVLVNRVWAHWKQQLISQVIFNCSANHHIETRGIHTKNAETMLQQSVCVHCQGRYMCVHLSQVHINMFTVYI